MSQNRPPDYLDHIQQAATDACSFVDGMAKDDFLADKPLTIGRERVGSRFRGTGRGTRRAGPRARR